MLANLTAINNDISRLESKYGREKNAVQLLAVSKGQSVEKMRAAYLAGQRSFGENYLQEALEKMESLPMTDIEWHFIGKIQRNKTKKIAELFAWVQSIDNHLIAKRLNEQRPEWLPPLNVCIEININHETIKSGVDVDHLFSLANECMALPRLRLRGLMAIPMRSNDFMQQRHAFHQLFELYQRLRERGLPLDTLSMDMSGDFEAAIAEGATMVRIGSGIFGDRH